MKVAVVGAGVAGLGATWMLNEHSDHEVHLFESDTRPGGHANTVDYSQKGSDQTTKVDTGFIVFNTVTYPNFLRFIESKSLPYIASEMSFAVTRDRGLYEWAGTSLGALFAQRRNIINPGQWRMVWDILRFNSASLKELKQGDKGESIGDFIRREGYSDSFRDNYLLPMTAAIWSTPPDKAALDFPAFTLLRFMHNHHLLQILDRPTWLTLANGSHSYVNAILAQLPPAQYHQNVKIVSCSTPVVEGQGENKVTLTGKDGQEYEFDHVIFACHADQTLRILKAGQGVTKDEENVLGGFTFSANRALLHSDTALMPKRRATWSAWNYLTASDGPRANVNSVALTYWMNLLQSIDEKVHGPVLVTLNPPFEPAADKIAGEWSYDHPLYTEKSVASQALMPTIQNKRSLTFCGAWTAYGFHEDGFSSGIRVAATYLSARPPFVIKDAERLIPSSLADTLLEGSLSALDLIRRIAESPFALIMMFAVAIIMVMENLLQMIGGGAAGETQQISADRLEVVRAVRRNWEASAGIVGPSGTGKRVKFA